jgi:hypothetical protein
MSLSEEDTKPTRVFHIYNPFSSQLKLYTCPNISDASCKALCVTLLEILWSAAGTNASEWGGYYANLSFSLLRPIQDKWTFDGAAGLVLEAMAYFGILVYGVPSLVKES